MREDMQKVIVERPRRGGRGIIYKPRRPGEDSENFSTREGIRRQWKDHKELSDNLSPLYRYLDKQVGRPWDTVWSEISERLDFRSVLGFHVKSHIDQHVSLHVRMVNGRAYAISGGSGWAPVYGMYVHPETRLLKRGYRWNAWRTADGKPFVPARRINKYEALRRILDDNRQLHLHRGQWYEVTLGPVEIRSWTVKEPTAWGTTQTVVKYAPTGDVLGTEAEELERRYGRKGIMAINKRQISRREKRRYAL